MRAVPAWLLIFPALAHAGQASEIARAIRELELDPAACHRVRDLVFSREDARFYLTDGYLIFARPLAGSPVAAVFAAAADGGDAEVLLLPPLGSERRSLASHTGAPNLSEHFDTAVLVFSDHTYRELRALIAASPASRPAPDVGMLLSENWTPVLRNIATSFETRLVFDLLSQVPEQEGFFNAAIRGRTRGNFDVHFDPRSREQIRAGQLNSRQDRTFFDVWTSFAARSWRNGLRHPFPPAFRLEDFRIEAVLDPGLRLDVVTRVKVAPAGIVRVLPFDISARMEVSAVTVDGRPAEVLQRESLRSNLIRNTGNNLFLIVPPAPLEPGRTYELEFRHSGSVVTRAPGGVYYVGSRANWYPNSGPGFATYDLAFRYPRDLDLVAGGELVEEKSEGEWRQSRHRIASPVRLAGFNLGRYERVRVERAGYVVDVYAPRESVVAAAAIPPLLTPLPPSWNRQRREVLHLPPSIVAAPPSLRVDELAHEVAAALEFMSARFGPPPLRSLTVSPVPGTFGQGFPGLVYLSTLAYRRPEDRAMASLSRGRQTFFSEILHAHETAHQWWGNTVTSSDYHDLWLMEALANYSALLYLEKRRGARALAQVLEEYRDHLVAEGKSVDSTGPLSMGSRLESSIAPEAWRAIIYGKGSWVMHMLRKRMGDARFEAMLSRLRREYEHKSISTLEFRRLAASFLPPGRLPGPPDPELEIFFEQWVHATGIPSFRLDHRISGKASAWKVTGTLMQSGVSEDFSVPVPIQVELPRAQPVVHWVRSSSEPVSFTIPLKQRPARVLLDPGLAILRQ